LVDSVFSDCCQIACYFQLKIQHTLQYRVVEKVG